MSLVIIHLTDIHIQNEKDLILQKAKKIANACSTLIRSKDEVLLVITGDIAFSGETNQYNLALDFLTEIIDSIEENCENKVEIAMVPGNHDCKIDDNDVVRDQLISDVTRDCKANNINEVIINNISKCHENYNTMFSLFCDKFINRNDICIQKRYELTFGKICVIMLNTAWMSRKKESPGSICITLQLSLLPII